MVKILLLKIWRLLPGWTQGVLSRIIRPKFQVFSAAVIFDKDNRIMLVKSTYQRFHPWGLPGGSLNYGEPPDDAVIREVWEETSLKSGNCRIIVRQNVDTRPGWHVLFVQHRGR